jgi:hypothetical protein
MIDGNFGFIYAHEDLFVLKHLKSYFSVTILP